MPSPRVGRLLFAAQSTAQGAAELERRNLLVRREPVDRALACLQVGRDFIQRQDFVFCVCHCLPLPTLKYNCQVLPILPYNGRSDQWQSFDGGGHPTDGPRKHLLSESFLM
jgi:hypothetical protein